MVFWIAILVWAFTLARNGYMSFLQVVVAEFISCHYLLSFRYVFDIVTMKHYVTFTSTVDTFSIRLLSLCSLSQSVFLWKLSSLIIIERISISPFPQSFYQFCQLLLVLTKYPLMPANLSKANLAYQMMLWIFFIVSKVLICVTKFW